MALRRLDGFQRYAFAVQYHGASFLGFSFQGQRNEDCILKDGTDLRGYRSVEGRIREALADLVGDDNYENLQVSSRTDRGVHALRNTCHVDICPRASPLENGSGCWDPCNLHRGLNYHLSRQHSYFERQQYASLSYKRRRSSSIQPPLRASRPGSPIQDLRILSVARAPRTMNNKFAHDEDDQPPTIDWNIRFSATQRTYVYRIFNMVDDERDYGVPFEWDRSWRICSERSLNVSAMNEAASYFVGTHDFTSFRGASCQRLSPRVTMKDIRVASQPYGGEGVFWTNSRGGLLGLGEPTQDSSTANLITVAIVGESFLYRQVRNMVGCLVNVGLEKMSPHDVKLVLQERNRAKAPAMAPAHGLFLVNVEHGDFVF